MLLALKVLGVIAIALQVFTLTVMDRPKGFYDFVLTFVLFVIPFVFCFMAMLNLFGLI